MSFPRPGRTRTVLLVVGLVVALGLGGVLAYKSPRIRAWFARDTDNPEELARLRETPPAVPPPAASSTGWPQWFGPLRDGRAPHGPFRTNWNESPPKQLWSVPCGGGFSSFAVVGERLYTQDRQGENERVLCLDAATGKQIWEVGYPAGAAGSDRTYATGPRATPTIDGTRVYTVGGSGKFRCLDAPADGPPRLLWEHDLPAEFDAKVPHWGYAGSPLVDGDQVIVQPGGRGAAVVAFDRLTGAVRWKAGSNPAGYSSPVATTVHGVRVVYAFTGNALLCVRADGEVLGSYDWATANEGNIATPLVLGEYVFISSAYHQGCALLRAKPAGDRVTLEPVYARRGNPLRTHHATAVARDKYLYGFDTEQGNLVCFDYTAGAVVEDWDAAGVRKGSLILAGKHLVILTQAGELILAEAVPDEYSEVARFPMKFAGAQNWALPVLVDGRLYLRGENKIVCLDVRP